MTFTLAVLNANFKVLIMTYKNCVATMFWIFASIMLYYIIFVLYDNGLETTDVFGTLTM